ncbi:MAG TPA: hypothetical protein VF498_16215, partial [Anaerolineales bacterium]
MFTFAPKELHPSWLLAVATNAADSTEAEIRAAFDRADVAVLFDYEQLYWGNRSHLQSVYRLLDYLPRRHILFDLITPEQLEG